MSAEQQPLVIRGSGAVSAAGWGVAALADAVTSCRVIETQNSPRTLGTRNWECRYRPVPAAPADRVPKHPRLRRASSITRFAVAAAEEAMAGRSAESLGIILCLTNACIGFTNRFYNEVLDTPVFASPIVFPETVFNAPASHLAAYLNVAGPVTTLIGESNLLCEALHTARDWMQSGQVQQCLVIGAEEADWLSSEALTYYDKRGIATEGAGALLLALEGDGPRISQVIGPHIYHHQQERQEQLQRTVSSLQSIGDAMLIDSAVGNARRDKDEQAAWARRADAHTLSPAKVLGEGMGSASALQLVLAASLAASSQQTIIISMPGTTTASYACVVR
jgi:3-oxoacyl-[acyl-carrier-protein] synthase II